MTTSITKIYSDRKDSRTTNVERFNPEAMFRMTPTLLSIKVTQHDAYTGNALSDYIIKREQFAA